MIVPLECDNEMNKIRITTCEQLEEWLENNNWLDHSVFLDVQPPFKPKNPKSSEGMIRLKVWVSGDIEPGSKRTWHKYIFRATGVTQWLIYDEKDWSPDGSLSDELEILEECSGVGFSARFSREIIVCCDELEIERLQDETDTVEPWLSCNDYSVTVAGRNLPTPQEWVTWFKTENIDVAWRCIYGNAKQAELIPVQDYSGWFLQVIDRIKHNDEGLFSFIPPQRKIVFMST